MTAPDLTSSTAKFEWANRHTDEFQTYVLDWAKVDAEPPVCFLRWEDEPQKRRTTIYIERLKDIPSDWPLLIGDILNNYRAALDYAACSLVRVGREPRKAENPGIYFPICWSAPRDFFNPRGKTRTEKLPGVALKYLRALSPFQPYKAREKERFALAALANLNRFDKHRKLLLTHHVMPLIRVDQAIPNQFRAQLVPPLRGQVQPDAKLLYLWWLGGSPPIPGEPPVIALNPDMRVKLTPIASVAFGDLIPGPEVLRTLDQIRALVEHVLGKIASQA